MLLDFQPAFIILEEVVQFQEHGLEVVADLLKDVYVLQWLVLDPKVFGWPVSRPRLYCVGVNRQVARLDGCLDGLLQACAPRGATGTGLDFFYLDLPMTH